MTPLNITSLIDWPYLRVNIEETDQFTIAAGVQLHGEAAIVLGYRALVIEVGRN